MSCFSYCCYCCWGWERGCAAAYVGCSRSACVCVYKWMSTKWIKSNNKFHHINKLDLFKKTIKFINNNITYAIMVMINHNTWCCSCCSCCNGGCFLFALRSWWEETVLHFLTNWIKLIKHSFKIHLYLFMLYSICFIVYYISFVLSLGTVSLVVSSF